MRNKRMRKISKNRIEFEMTQRGLIAPAVFILLGIIAAVSIFRSWGSAESRDLIIMCFFAVGAVGVGITILRKELIPQVFDRESGFYYVGDKEPYYLEGKFIGIGCTLNEIHAIQLIQEVVGRHRREWGIPFFFTYELNLVLKDGSRINIIDHTKRKATQAEAKELSRFLKVPIWDATFSGQPRIFGQT